MTETVLETERLRLRRLTADDFGSLCLIMKDDETMRAYEGAFSDREVNEWIGEEEAFLYPLFQVQKKSFACRGIP